MFSRSLALALLVSLGLSGCVFFPSFGDTRRIDIATLNAPPEAIAVEYADVLVTTGDVEVDYDELAILSVGPRGHDSIEELIADLRAAAVEAGADAVVRVDFDVYGGGEDGFLRRTATGTAVRYK